MFSLPVRLAAPRGLEGMPEELSQPEYATAVGLLLYGAHARRTAAQRPAYIGGEIEKHVRRPVKRKTPAGQGHIFGGGQT